MLRDSVAVAVVVVRTRPRAIPLAMITMRKFIDGFPFLSHMSMGLRLAALRAAGAPLLKGNRSSFSKQLGINCTCGQIGLFLISTRGCGSHSWKLLKTPICSRVQLIPNCFSNRPISYTKTPGLSYYFSQSPFWQDKCQSE